MDLGEDSIWEVIVWDETRNLRLEEHYSGKARWTWGYLAKAEVLDHVDRGNEEKGSWGDQDFWAQEDDLVER